MVFETGAPARLLGFGLSLALLAAPAQAGQIHSNLQIEPARTFESGGGQEGSFVVTGRNTGPVAVVVLAQAPGAKPAVRGTVAPGGDVQAAFGPREMALLLNTSAKATARLKLTISGDTSSLGMTYSANP